MGRNDGISKYCSPKYSHAPVMFLLVRGWCWTDPAACWPCTGARVGQRQLVNGSRSMGGRSVSCVVGWSSVSGARVSKRLPDNALDSY